MKIEAPTAEEVVWLRTGVQSSMGLGITAAQDWCAVAVHTSRRAWQQWESGERRMHAAFWELARIKVSSAGKARPTKVSAEVRRTAPRRAARG
jgi:hypothetical protein